MARIKNNSILNERAKALMAEMAVNPRYDADETVTWCIESTYQAQSWSKARRVVLMAEHNPLELFVKHYWVITSQSSTEQSGPELLASYRERGTAESGYGDFKSVMAPRLAHVVRTRDTSTPVRIGFERNEAELILCAIAFNVMNGLRRLVELALKVPMSLQRLRERVLKVAVRVVHHARTVRVTVARAAESIWRALWLTQLPLVRA